MKKIIISCLIIILILPLCSCGRKYVNIEHFDGSIEKCAYGYNSYKIELRPVYGKILLGYYDSNNEKVLDYEGKVVSKKMNYETNLKAVYEDFSSTNIIFEGEEIPSYLDMSGKDTNLTLIRTILLSIPTVKFEIKYDFSVKGRAEDFYLYIQNNRNSSVKIDSYYLGTVNNSDYVQYKYNTIIYGDQLSEYYYLSWHFSYNDGTFSYQKNCYVRMNKVEIIISL